MYSLRDVVMTWRKVTHYWSLVRRILLKKPVMWSFGVSYVTSQNKLLSKHLSFGHLGHHDAYVTSLSWYLREIVCLGSTTSFILIGGCFSVVGLWVFMWVLLARAAGYEQNLDVKCCFNYAQ